jgi:hypothetical protein
MALTPQEVFTYRGKRYERYLEEPFQRFCIGVDLGQSQDYTAIAVLDHRREPLDEWDVDEARGRIKQKVHETFDVRHLERLPLGMLYPDQVGHVQRLLIRPPLRDKKVPVVFDCTSNVGAVDIAEQMGLRPVRIVFTAGHEPTGQGRKWGVPKSLLVSTLDAKLHCGELRFAKELLAAEAVRDELQNFQRHVSQSGKMLFEHRSGQHDDLIFAIAMPLWWTISRRKQNLTTYGVVGMY